MTPAELQRILNANPDLTVQEWAAQQRHEAEPEPVRTPLEGDLARHFEFLWTMWDGPELQREYRFHVQRRWRLDYYHDATKTGIELEGGVYTNGRHTRAAGYLGDLEKYNEAAMQGITVLRLGTGMVDHIHVAAIIDYITRRAP